MKKSLLSFVLLLAALSVPMAAHASIADVNGDGEVSLADINVIIDAILSGTAPDAADVNGDGEVTLADINSVLSSILDGVDPTPPPGPGGLDGFSDETLALLRDYGMKIYDGNEPPVVEGVYAMEPVDKIGEYGWEDWEDATKMLKIIFNFKEQDGGKILYAGGSYQQDLDTDEVYAEGDNEFMLANINGQGNKFTISYTEGSDDPDDITYFLGGVIISGEMTDNGIKNLQIASVIFALPELGIYDIMFDMYADSDGISYPSEWPEWPEDDWIKSAGPYKVNPLMMSRARNMVKSLLESHK